MNDLISRQAAKNKKVYSEERHEYVVPVAEIDWLPPAQPEPCEDTVSRQRLLSDLKELVAAWNKYPVMAEQIKGVEAAIGYVEAIPSAQPEIIRCKDCKEFRRWIDTDITFCDCIESEVKEDDFCSRAERRTDERI